MSAARLPSLAAATVTLAALPPRHFPNDVTCSRPTPIWSGYTSTPDRPMASASYVAPAPEAWLAVAVTTKLPSAVCVMAVIGGECARCDIDCAPRDRVLSRLCPDILTF